MALPILDGNQSATTLSTILTGGQHIPAHTVVSLGSQAITDVRSAVSGSVVTISNFPATQTIAGTVTANVGNSITIGALPYTTTITGVGSNFGQGGALAGSTVTAVPVILSSQGAGGAIQGFNGTNAFLNVGIQNVGGTSLNGVQTGLPISGTVTVGNSVTIGSLPAISGTVTANLSKPTWTNYSGTIVTAGTAVTAISTITRSYLLAQVTTGQMFLNIGATATSLNSVYFSAGQGFAWETSVPQGLVSIISAVTGTNYVLKEG
jgi:hypothetical protein